jgi:hypothetical protein
MKGGLDPPFLLAHILKLRKNDKELYNFILELYLFLFQLQ